MTLCETNETLLAARKVFVEMIKKENFEGRAIQSLKAHWAGAVNGFSNHMVQNRWNDFYSGYKSAIKNNEK